MQPSYSACMVCIYMRQAWAASQPHQMMGRLHGQGAARSAAPRLSLYDALGRHGRGPCHAPRQHHGMFEQTVC